jgi:hypothetical protein
LSETETITNESEIVESPEIVEETETVDLSAELEKWKTLSRKNEQQAKANAAAAKELDELKKSQLTDQERLVESTKEETRRAVRMEFATKLVDAELKSALNGRVLDGGSLLEFDKSKFIDDDGNVDSESVTAWVEAHSSTGDVSKPDLGQGNRGEKSRLAQITSRDELSNMSPADILAARKDGRLDSLMGKN